MHLAFTLCRGAVLFVLGGVNEAAKAAGAWLKHFQPQLVVCAAVCASMLCFVVLCLWDVLCLVVCWVCAWAWWCFRCMSDSYLWLVCCACRS
jgi:hypothetical protein